MKKKFKKVGILGGIGPEATGNFYLSLIERLQKSNKIKSNLDFPQIIINSIPAPELIYEKIPKKDLNFYIKGLKELESFNPDFIVMVCNTIHLFYDELQKETKVPIIDLRKEVEHILKKKKIYSTTVVGSPGVINGGLYNYEGIKTYNLPPKDIKRISEAVFEFNKGENKYGQAKKVRNIIEKHIKMTKVQLIIVGCTEISLMLERSNLPILNTIDILLEATIRRFLK
jgi:aspartate racemase